MLEAIKHGLKNVTRFDGRDARQTFWFYALFLFLIQIAVGLIVAIPAAASAADAAVRAAQAGDPDRAAQAAMGSMGGMMGSLAWASVIIGALVTLLIAAAFVRRLHDSNLPGWLALVPGALYVWGLARVQVQMDRVQAALAEVQAGNADVAAIMQQSDVLGTLLAWVPLLLVVLLGIRKSAPGDNAYGPQPVAT